MNHTFTRLGQFSQFPRDHQAGLSSDAIMRHVCYALIPGVLLQTAFYGVGLLIQLSLAIITACLCESINALLRKRRLDSLSISSGCLSGCLLAISIPATAPWWLIIIAVAFGLLLGKHVFGGVGMNIFNPALVGFCAVYLSFPAAMSLYPNTFIDFSDTLRLIFQEQSVDGVVGATHLAALKANGTLENTSTTTLSYWWINIAWCVGGLYLWLKKLADWRLSAIFAWAFIIFTLGFALLTDNQSISVTQHIGLGSLFFTACFIITDPTTAATSRLGRIIYAILAAGLAVIIRQYSNMPDSFAFAILLANLSAPMIDNYTKPQYVKN